MVDIPDGRFFAVKQILQQQMQAAIDLYTQKLGQPADSVVSFAKLTSEAISFHRKQDYTRVLYRCAIALKLANVCNQSAVDLATCLVTFLPKLTQDSDCRAVISFTIEVVPPGWIDFYLTDQGIAAWLQSLISLPVEWEMGIRVNEGSVYLNSPLPHSPTVPCLFPIQYAHARCCSLLRLGHQEGLITLSTHTPIEMQAKSLRWQVIEPNPIPWLNGERQLYLVHPDERHLIVQLLGILDELSTCNQPAGIKFAEAMESFYRRVRIFDEVKIQQPQLAQARLGLVAVTRLLLQSLLENWLGVCAPEEL